jgi:kynureninase
MIFKNSRAFAQQCDREDPLSSFRKEFLLPTDTQGNELIYLCGNSLGLQPLKTKDYIQQDFVESPRRRKSESRERHYPHEEDRPGPRVSRPLPQ